MNSLTLFCGTEVVGKCDFDLASFIGKEPKYQTAHLVEESHEATGPGEYVLRGTNLEKYGGAQIQFRVSCSKYVSKNAGGAAGDSASVRSQIKKGQQPSKPAAAA